jgi:ribonuclease HII
MSAARYRIGIDENGLGPRLGPMIVTGVLARVSPEGARLVGRAAKGALAQRLGDSKALVAHGNVALGEAWARALVMRGAGRAHASLETVDDLIHAMALDDRQALRARCPAHVEAQCWGRERVGHTADEALVRAVTQDLDKLARRGVEILAVRQVILCARRMNDEAAAGNNKFKVDLHAMERLVLELRALADEDVYAVCGKVGGFGRYGAAFGPLAGHLFTTLEESRARSAYHFAGIGEVAFVRDADASDLSVGLASMVGKYTREALMTNITRFYRATNPTLPDASGYYDPVTSAFIAATSEARAALTVPDTCFERRGADEREPRTAKLTPVQ